MNVDTNKIDMTPNNLITKIDVIHKTIQQDVIKTYTQIQQTVSVKLNIPKFEIAKAIGVFENLKDK